MRAIRVAVTEARVQVKPMTGTALLHNNKNGEDCFLGGDDVTVTNGFPFPKEAYFSAREHGEVWAVCNAGKSTVIHVCLW